MIENQIMLKEKLELMLEEVRLLAAIQDVNVIRYYSSWIEMIEERKHYYTVQESIKESEEKQFRL